MPYYDGEDIPGNIVYSFKEDCEFGNIENINSSFPIILDSVNNKTNIFKQIIHFFLKKKLYIIEEKNKILPYEYNYAFWYGLLGAAKGNQIKVLEYLLKNPYLKNELDFQKIKYTIKNHTPNNGNDLDCVVFDGPTVSPIDISLPLFAAAHLGHFYFFQILAKTDIQQHLHCDFILSSVRLRPSGRRYQDTKPKLLRRLDII